jgi:hypothetical protein
MMLRAILTFVLVFALLAVLSGLVGWAGPLEVGLLVVLAAAVTVAVMRFVPGRRDVG